MITILPTSMPQGVLQAMAHGIEGFMLISGAQGCR